MTERAALKWMTRSSLYAFFGVLLGVLAPLGWIAVSIFFFVDWDQGIWPQVTSRILESGETLSLYIYMGGGTAAVLGLFGFVIGRASHELHLRAGNLDSLNRTIALEKENFERSFEELKQNIKDFHALNTHIQKSVDSREVLRLAAESLHEIIGYDRVNVLMLNRKKDLLEFVASRGSGDDQVDDLKMPMDDRSGALFKAVNENRVFLVEDITRMPAEYHLKPPCDAIRQLRSRTFILCPIVIQGEVVGLLGVDNKVHRKKLDDTDVDNVKLFADQVASALTKIDLIEAVESLTGELELTFEELLKYREEHSRLDGALHLATSATGEAIREIAEAADVVREAVESSRSAAGEISVSIEQVSQNMDRLNRFMESSISSMTQISATIKAVEESGVQSQQMSEKVMQQAEKGAEGVSKTEKGLRGISGAVEDAVAAIDRLSRKGEEIDGINEVITEVTQKTNLLALNAAIIAAQAGEHGRTFAVVAEEIRSLSQEAANSTVAISGIISEIKGYTREAVDFVGKSRNLVEEGVTLGQEMEVFLRQILESAITAVEMASKIRNATQEMVGSVESVSRSIETLGEMSGQITHASREQSQGTRSIAQSIEEVKHMADDMVSATERQQRNTREIEEASNSVREMITRIFKELEMRQQRSREVIRQLESLKQENVRN